MEHVGGDTKDSHRLGQRQGLAHLRPHRFTRQNLAVIKSYRVSPPQVRRYFARGGGSCSPAAADDAALLRVPHAWVDGIDGELLQKEDWAAFEGIHLAWVFLVQLARACGRGGRRRMD
jgi:hypothetical protein